jgi:serine/threonine-protein kinase
MYRVCDKCRLPNALSYHECPECKGPLAHLPQRDGASLQGAIIEKRYRMEEFVGEGAMAWVYRGTHVELGSSVAIKLLKPTFAQDARFLARFKKEATAIGALSHPNILSVITSGDTSTGIPYMVCEFIKGASLGGVLQAEGRLPWKRSLQIFSQILSALDEAHSREVVHRDLKPDNIMVMAMRSGEDFCKIVDFGIALHQVPNEQRLTQHGEIFGTPEYMAPETIKGGPATPASDLYSAGIILYEMITGQLPFTGPAIFDVLLAHIEKRHVPPTQIIPELPPEIDAVMDRVLTKNPAERIQSAAEFKKLLQFTASPPLVMCGSCKQEMRTDHKFCPHCGATNRALVQAGKVESIAVMETLERILVKEKPFSAPFFGRDREKIAIADFLRSRKLCMEISGELGIGKTALVRSALTDLGNIPVAVHHVDPDPLGCQRSWWPVRQLARTLAGLPEHPGLDDLLGICMVLELDPEDVPHLLHLFELDADQPTLEFQVRLREMITSVARFICAATNGRPTLLVFQDVDVYDLPSCRVLEQLYFMIQGLPIKLITTGEHPLFMADSMPAELYEHLKLGRLGDEVARDLGFVVMSENSCSWHGHLSALVSAAGGLPLHLLEGMRLLTEGGAEVDMPLVDLVQLRVRRLPKKAQHLLQWISIYGNVVPESVAELALGIGASASQAVDVCERRGFLRRTDGGDLQLAHPLVARLILEEMPATLRAEIHEELLESPNAAFLDPHVLAFHALYAQRLEEASRYFEQAAAHCEFRLDDQGAVFYYRKAHDLAKMEALSGLNELRYAQISARYGDLLRYAGQLHAAETVLREALTFCQDCASCEATILASMARCCAASPDGRAEDLINRATKMAQKARDPQVLYRVFHDLGQIEMQKGRFDLGITQLRTGLAMLEGTPRMPPSTWRLYLQCAQFEFLRGKTEQAIETCMSALEKPFVTRSYLACSRLHEQLASMFIQLKRRPEAVAHLKKTVQFMLRTGDRVSLVENTLHLGELDDELGVEWAENALSLSSRIGFFKGMEQAGTLLAAHV